MIPQALREYLAAHRDRHVRQLCDLLRYPSVSSQSSREGDCLACAQDLAGQLGRMGFQAELRPWRQHPVVLARRAGPPGARTVLVYGHYDVQPPEPLELWKSPPFEPDIRDGAIHARGASDDKGPLYAHLMAFEALLATRGELPLNVLALLEGEEEIGSPELERFMAANAAELKADFAVISDSEFFAAGLPSITYGLRGLVYTELTLTGPAGDLHSGTHGGAVRNPINALARMVAGMHDEQGRVTLPGFYDDVAPLSDQERAAWGLLPFDERQYAAEVGALPTGGEAGYSLLERRWARPTLDCNGIIGGYTGEGSKTVLPSRATAKISMRLVADQRPERVVEGFRRYVAEQTPPGVRAEVKISAEARPVLIDPDGPAMRAAADALGEAFGGPVAMIRNGASVPIAELIQRVLKVQPVLMGFGLPDDNLHAPNERFRLEQYFRGIAASAALLMNLARPEGAA